MERATRSYRDGATSPGGVVVGVDASLGVLAAVSWAAAEAARRRVSLHLVQVRPGADDGIAHRSPTLRRARAVASAVAPGIPTSAASLVGAPGPVLRARAWDADLLVVGSRRPTEPSCEHDGTTRFLRQRTSCPTAFVPARWAGSWASTPSARPVVVGLADTPHDRVVRELAERIARRLGVELIPVRSRGRHFREQQDLVAALLDVGRWAQLIVVAGPAPHDHDVRRHGADLEGLLRRRPCAVLLAPSSSAGRGPVDQHVGGAAVRRAARRPIPTGR